MKYYLHDSNAFNDEKITELYIKFGYEGLGLFYTALEKFAGQEQPIKTGILKHQLKVGKRLEKCWKFMEGIGIISSSNGESFNKQLLNFSETYRIKKERNAKRIAEWRLKHENVTHSESVRNTPKVNKSKVNKSKDICGAVEPLASSLNPLIKDKEKEENPINTIFSFWGDKFKLEFGMTYPAAFGKEGKLLKDLLKMYNLETIKNLIIVFFDMSKHNDWLKDKVSIGVFRNQLPKVIVEMQTKWEDGYAKKEV